MRLTKAGAAPLPDLAAFLAPFAALVRRSESRHALERYATGLLSDLPRKTAAGLGRALDGTNGQQLQELLTRTAWDAAAMDQRRVALMVARASVGQGVIILDDTGFAKKGTHSVGVARQYSGTLGRVDNCQVLVTAHYVDRVFDWPLGAQLYLPDAWTADRARCQAAQIPAGERFATKGALALALVDRALTAGVVPRAVVSDAGYGDQPTVLDGLEARGLPYLVGLKGTIHLRLAARVAADTGDVPVAYAGHGRPRQAVPLERRVPTQPVAALIAALPETAWETVAWREGTNGSLVKQVARVRVHRAGHRGRHLATTGWLLAERPRPGHTGETKGALAWGLDALTLGELVELAHVRWVIERFYQDAKGELGLDDYEGRSWPGLHRHVALTMLAHSYLTLRQSYGAEVLASPGAAPDPPGPDEPAPRTRPPPARPRGFPPGGPPEHRRPASRRARRTL